MPDLYYEIAGNQMDGARDYQEDAFLTTYMDDASSVGSKFSALVVMADGMGGHAAGNIASNLVVSTFNKMFTGEFGKKVVATILRECLDKANNALKDSIRETPALDGMGCTMVTAAFTHDKVWWVSVGDSHLYLIRDRELVKKNQDHSYGGYLDRMKAQGMDIEPEPGLSRNMLMSAMTGDEVAEVDCPDEPLALRPGDRVVIASDGLDTLSQGGILQFSAWAATPKECVDALLKAVEDAKKPRQDNTTVIVIDVAARAAMPATSEVKAPRELPPETTKPRDQEEDEEEGAIPSYAQEFDVSTTVIEERTSKGLGKGAIIGIVATFLLILMGAGAWLFVLSPPEGEVPAIAKVDGEQGADEQGGEQGADEQGGEQGADEQGGEQGADEQGGEQGADEQGGEQGADEQGGEQGADEQGGEQAITTPVVVAGGELEDNLVIGGKGPLMVEIPAGRYAMGALGVTARQDEYPQHEVEVRAFAISKNEITMTQYETFAKATGRKMPETRGLDKDAHPVTFVSWEDASAYARWLGEQTGKHYRLPSEAEWEYAARAGTRSPYGWGNETGSDNAHCLDCGTGLDSRQQTKVGRFKPNPFGIGDTAGNVQEWVQDCYKNSYVGAPTDGAVWEHGECTYRVTRGGSYDNPGESMRSSSRNKRRPSTGYDSVGIRVVRDR